jgi:uncharacterized protein (DUF2147 family)
MRVKTGKFALIMAATAACVLAAAPGHADRKCDGKPKTIKLNVKVQHQRPIEIVSDGKNHNVAKVCIGDVIRWKLKDSDKKFHVDFYDGAPFVGDSRRTKKNGEVELSINKAESGKTYRYRIEFNNDEALQASLVIL